MSACLWRSRGPNICFWPPLLVCLGPKIHLFDDKAHDDCDIVMRPVVERAGKCLNMLHPSGCRYSKQRQHPRAQATYPGAAAEAPPMKSRDLTASRAWVVLEASSKLYTLQMEMREAQATRPSLSN